MVSLAYNIGVPGSSGVFELVNAGNFGGAANMISSMTHGHEVRKGKRVRVFYRGPCVPTSRRICPIQKRSRHAIKECGQMRRILMQIASRPLLLGVLALPGVRAYAQDPNADIYGKWRIKALIGGGIGSLSDHQARQLIGKLLIISAEKFAFNGHTCTHPNYQRSREDPTVYFDRKWHTDVSDIPFPNPVTIIETAGCDYVYPIRKNSLMIAEGGGFFEAVRVKTAPINRTSSDSGTKP